MTEPQNAAGPLDVPVEEALLDIGEERSGPRVSGAAVMTLVAFFGDFGPGGPAGELGKLGGEILKALAGIAGGKKFEYATVSSLLSYHLQFCKYLTFKPAIPAGKRARIRVEDNETERPVYGAVEMFVTPEGSWNPATDGSTPPGSPRVTFGGDGHTTVNGPGVLTLHLKTNTRGPKVTVTTEDIP